ncbi:MAG: NAD(P)H-dependent oxidoreductase [Pseudomonadota bacterium]
MDPRQLLVISHCPSPNVVDLSDAVVAGAREGGESAVTVRSLSPFDANPRDVRNCDGIILGTTENFGYMSGALKDFFDRIYESCLNQTAAKPYALFVKAGQDGSGARDSVERIVTGLRWRRVAEPLVMTGPMQKVWLAQCTELGATMGAGLSIGLF